MENENMFWKNLKVKNNIFWISTLRQNVATESRKRGQDLPPAYASSQACPKTLESRCHPKF